MAEDRQQKTNDVCSDKIIGPDKLEAALMLYRAHSKRARLVSGIFDNPLIGQAFFPALMPRSGSYDEPWLCVGVFLGDNVTNDDVSCAAKQRAERIATLPFVDQVFFFRGSEHLLEIVSKARDIFSVPIGGIRDCSCILITSYGGQEFDSASLPP